MSQRVLVLEHLKNRGSITSMEAFRLYGITRLSGIIFRLRGSGYIIDSDSETTKNRYGKEVTYARYRLLS